jgi:carbon monoxide dehydrogenase subunit G
VKGRHQVTVAFCTRLVVAALLVAAATAPAVADAADPQVAVSEDGDGYVVTASFTVSQSLSAAVTVLSDYERIPQFMPEVRVSRIVERMGDVTTVEQEAVASFMMFSKRVHMLLDIHSEPGAIRFRDRSARSFARYEGSWAFAEVDGGTAITYELRARPTFAIPEFVIKRLLKRDATAMIRRLQTEIAARN